MLSRKSGMATIGTKRGENVRAVIFVGFIYHLFAGTFKAAS